MAVAASTYDTATTSERAAHPALQLVKDKTETTVDRIEDNEAWPRGLRRHVGRRRVRFMLGASTALARQHGADQD